MLLPIRPSPIVPSCIPTHPVELAADGADFAQFTSFHSASENIWLLAAELS